MILASHFRFQSTRWSNNLQTFHVFLCHNIIIQMSLASVGNGNEGTRRRFIPPVINQDFAMPVNWLGRSIFLIFCLIFDLVVFYVPSNSSRCDLNPAKINVFLSSFVNGASRLSLEHSVCCSIIAQAGYTQPEIEQAELHPQSPSTQACSCSCLPAPSGWSPMTLDPSWSRPSLSHVDSLLILWWEWWFFYV